MGVLCDLFVAPTTYGGWHIEPVAGGTNNLLYHVSGAADCAVKFTLRDQRQRCSVTDPAFEIADINDRRCEIRIRTYWHTLAIWWVIRFARYLYEIPRGLDSRLVERSRTWKEIDEQKYTHYLNLIDQMAMIR